VVQAKTPGHKLHLCMQLGRAGQGRAGQGSAGRAGPGRTGQSRAGQGRAGQGRAGQGRAYLIVGRHRAAPSLFLSSGGSSVHRSLSGRHNKWFKKRMLFRSFSNHSLNIPDLKT